MLDGWVLQAEGPETGHGVHSGLLCLLDCAGATHFILCCPVPMQMQYTRSAHNSSGSACSDQWCMTRCTLFLHRCTALRCCIAYSCTTCPLSTVVQGILYSSLILSNQNFEPERPRTRAIVWMLALRGSWDLLLWLHASSLLRTLLKPDGWQLVGPNGLLLN